MVEAPVVKRFKMGWFGDGGFGESLIEAVLTGRKTATICPVYDPEDAELNVGDVLEMTDKHNKARGTLIVTGTEIRPYGRCDESLARCIGTTLQEFWESIKFANGRQIRPEEEMRVVYFKIVGPKIKL